MAQPKKFLGLCPQNSATIPSKLKFYGSRTIGNAYIAYNHATASLLQAFHHYSHNQNIHGHAPIKLLKLVPPPPPGLLKQHITRGCL